MSEPTEAFRKFRCQNCSQPVEVPETLVNTEINCPGCQKKIFLRAKDVPIKESNRLKASAETIDVVRNLFLCLAVGLLGIGFLVMPVLIAFAGFAFGFVVFFLVLGQSYHIRSALERANEQREE